jgi:hypothetical protein
VAASQLTTEVPKMYQLCSASSGLMPAAVNAPMTAARSRPKDSGLCRCGRATRAA